MRQHVDGTAAPAPREDDPGAGAWERQSAGAPSTRTREGDGFVWGDALAHDVAALADAAHTARQAGRTSAGLATGHASVDRILNGLQSSSLYVLGGAPGVGKTTLALQWACQIADAGAPVLYVSFENTPGNLALKAVCRLARVSSSSVERGRESPERLAPALREFGRFGARLRFVHGHTTTSVDDVETEARAAMAAHGATRCLVVIDYLQRMAYRERYSKLRENVSALSLRIRQLADHLESPVLVLSSLSRSAGDLTVPTMEMLRESGDLEYAADVVLLLGARRDLTMASAARAKSTGGARLLDLYVGKNRFGEAESRIPLFFNAVIGEFVEETTA